MATSEKRLFSRFILAGAVFSAVAVLDGCSVIFRAEAAQCSTDGDCRARGAAFATTVCKSGTCVAAPLVIDGGVEGGKDATVIVEATVDAGVDASPETSVACRSNADCPVTDPVHAEVMCDIASGQ